MSRLEEIVRAKRIEAAALTVPTTMQALRKQAETVDGPRGFLRTLKSTPRALIAEVKRASPSRGLLTQSFDPGEMAKSYERGGAEAISVLTDKEFFKGSAEDLVAARTAVRCPVLRKDFVLTQAQVLESRAMGADAVLLIARILKDEELVALREAAHRLGMDALIEAHNEEEVLRAVASGATLVGINNRDLDTFHVDLTTSERLRRVIPEGIVTVSESGVMTKEDADRLYEAGFDAILVGEGIVRTEDREAAVRALRPHAASRPVR